MAICTRYAGVVSLALIVMLGIICDAAPIENAASSDFDLGEYQFAYRWLKHYRRMNREEESSAGECESCEPETCKEHCMQTLKEAIKRPIERFKRFYGLEEKPVSGDLTQKALDTMGVKRCEKKDDDDAPEEEHHRVKRFSRLASTSWDLRRTPVLTISFRNYLNSLPRGTQERIAEECGILWATPSRLVFKLGPFGSATNIGIDFKPMDGPWNSLGTGQSPNLNSYSYLSLDSGERWIPKQGQGHGGPSLKWAMCHEMGHNLNLGHSNDRNAMMYPSAVGQSEEVLSFDDRRGIQSLYGGSNGKTFINRSSNRRPTTRRPPTRRPPTRRPSTRRPPVRKTFNNRKRTQRKQKKQARTKNRSGNAGSSKNRNSTKKRDSTKNRKKNSNNAKQNARSRKRASRRN